MNKKDEYIVKKNYKEKEASDILRFGNDFVDEFFLDGKSTEIPINALRVVFNIVSTLRNEQFQGDKQPQQLKLFEDEFTSEHNIYAKMSIRNSLITSNTEVLKKTYDYLELFKRGWYKFKASDGRTISALGGLISNVFHEENGYTSFLISSYWVKKLIAIPEYNKTLYNLVYKVRSNKHILFWFWLSKVSDEGTKVKRETLNKIFKVNYSNSKDLCGKFLKPIRENLNKYNYKSFNYSIDGEIIHIKPYLIKTIESEGLKEKTVVGVENSYKLRYFKDRHQLSSEQMKGIEYIYKNRSIDKEILNQAYKSFVENCRRIKKKATDYTGVEFLEAYQEFIRQDFHKTSTGQKYPDTYPRI